MDHAAGLEEATVALQKERRAEPRVLAAAELRVAEREPNLGHLPRPEERVYKLDPRPQERHIRERLLRGILGPLPQAGAFDIDPYVIDFRMPERQGNRVVPLSAPQLQHNGMVVAEHLPAPVPLDGMVPEAQLLAAGHLVQHLGSVRLQQAAESLVLREFL